MVRHFTVLTIFILTLSCILATSPASAQNVASLSPVERKTSAFFRYFVRMSKSVCKCECVTKKKAQERTRKQCGKGCKIGKCRRNGEMGVKCCKGKSRSPTLMKAEVCGNVNRKFPLMIVGILSDGSRVPFAFTLIQNKPDTDKIIKCINKRFSSNTLKPILDSFAAGSCSLNGAAKLQTCEKRNSRGMCLCTDTSNCYMDVFAEYTRSCISK